MAQGDIYRLAWQTTNTYAVAVQDLYYEQVAERDPSAESDEGALFQAFFDLGVGSPAQAMQQIQSTGLQYQGVQVQRVRPTLGRAQIFDVTPQAGQLEDDGLPMTMASSFSWGSQITPNDRWTNRTNIAGIGQSLVDGPGWGTIALLLLQNIADSLEVVSRADQPGLTTYTLQYRRNPTGKEEEAEYSRSGFVYPTSFPRRVPSRTSRVI